MYQLIIATMKQYQECLCKWDYVNNDMHCSFVTWHTLHYTYT